MVAAPPGSKKNGGTAQLLGHQIFANVEKGGGCGGSFSDGPQACPQGALSPNLKGSMTIDPWFGHARAPAKWPGPLLRARSRAHAHSIV